MQWFQLLKVALVDLTFICLFCMSAELGFRENCDSESMCNDVQDDSLNGDNNDETDAICKTPGIYPDPKSDEGYYICARSENGVDLVMYFRCFSGLIYDPRSRQCLNQDDYGRSLNHIEGGGRFIGLAQDVKNKNYSDDTGSDMRENTSNSKKDEKESVCNEPGKQKHPSSCFKYIMCIPSKNSIDTFYELERRCPRGTAFSTKYRQCLENLLRSCYNTMEKLKTELDYYK